MRLEDSGPPTTPYGPAQAKPLRAVRPLGSLLPALLAVHAAAGQDQFGEVANSIPVTRFVACS